ncbi:TPA: RecE family exodeoxyribonuclease [Escherichia coli]
MSTDKQVYPLYYEAKNDKVRKRLGIKGGFYWAEAKKLSIAISRGAVAIDDAGYDEDDFKKPVRVNLPVVDDLSPEGVFDTEFCNRYEKGGEDGITMVFIAPSSSAQDKPASTDNTNVNGEDMTEIEENMLLPISGQELPIRWLAQHGSEKPVTHVSRDELQALHIARAEELPAVTALAVSHKTSLLDPLEIRDLHKLVRDTDRVFPNPGNSSLGLMTAFFEAYLDADYTDRGLLTKEWMKGNRVSRITRTASGANAGGGNCPDCGAVMGDATYQKTFNEENQNEYQEKGLEEMEGAEHPHKENAGSNPHCDCSDEAGETTAPVVTEIMWPSYFEPGRYENLPNEVYHSANGISSTMLKDARISLMYYHGRHIAGTIPGEESDALLRGRIIHSYVLETDKFADEYAIPVPVPEYVVTTSNELIAIIKKHNASLPALMTPEQMKEWIESYNSTLIQPLSVSAGAEETGILYGSLPEEFRRIPEGEKHTASAMKACIKEYNASLPPLLKASGTREQLLEQIETVDPELAKKERAKSLPYNISGTKEQLTEIARKIRPELVTLEDWQKRQQEENAGKTFISPDMYEQAKNIHAALQNNTDAARLLNHPDRKSEISYFGFDEETGLEIRVRPDIEIRLPYESICADVKSVSLGYVRQERLKDRLHREIIERDYHLSAAMYCDVANLDKFFWIFVNKDAGYHWVAVVEASQELLELGRQEYRRTLRQINEALETNNWPAPITESYTDELNDFDLRRLEALSI